MDSALACHVKVVDALQARSHLALRYTVVVDQTPTVTESYIGDNVMHVLLSLLGTKQQ